jgi:hypothetical protein
MITAIITVSDAPWRFFGLGLLLGATMGFLLRDSWVNFREARRLRKVKDEESPDEEGDLASEYMEERHKQARAKIEEDYPGFDLMEREDVQLVIPAWRTVMIFTIAAFLCAIGILQYIDRQSRHDYEICQAKWRQEFAVAYEARQEPIEVTLDSLKIWMKAWTPIVKHGATKKRTEALSTALEDFNQEADRLARRAENNPPPPLPVDLCGQQP